MEQGLLQVLLLLALSVCVSSRIFHVVPELMSWWDAQTYCRQYYTDLATFADQTEVDEWVKTVVTVSTTNLEYWNGLYGINFTAPRIWSDQSNSMFRLWNPGQPNEWNVSQICVLSSPDGFWWDRSCTHLHPSVCYSWEKTQIVRVQVKSSQNMNDQVQKGILQKIEQVLKEKGLQYDAKLSWKKQTDGNVFQKIQKHEVHKQTCN
ncbi:lactose-binding lectin l-2-like isoform X1 [Myxocyprinus asiaticus]|uniref:lactose-binding lectin l-2-like isoform X1 n=1 Tax=Myxocyprinus asiaticus TaxID=70543 RepID=UPI002223CBCD|nr:lactose-binding lectin l-2-like isoform X1 [Myxocyprinus asiaticus]